MKKEQEQKPPLPPYIIFLFTEPFGKFDNELWKIPDMRSELKMHVIEKPDTLFSESVIVGLSAKLQQLEYRRGFDYMICYHKETEEENSENVIVLHVTDEAFQKLREEIPALNDMEVKEV